MISQVVDLINKSAWKDEQEYKVSIICINYSSDQHKNALKFIFWIFIRENKYFVNQRAVYLDEGSALNVFQ